MALPVDNPHALMASYGLESYQIQSIMAAMKKQEDKKRYRPEDFEDRRDDEDEDDNPFVPPLRPQSKPSTAPPSAAAAIKAAAKKSPKNSPFGRRASAFSAGHNTIRRPVAKVGVATIVDRQLLSHVLRNATRDLNVGIDASDKGMMQTAMAKIESTKRSLFVRLAQRILDKDANSHVLITLNSNDEETHRGIVHDLSLYGSGLLTDTDSVGDFQRGNTVRVLVGYVVQLETIRDLADRSQGSQQPRHALISPPRYKDHLDKVKKHAMASYELVCAGPKEATAMAQLLDMPEEEIMHEDDKRSETLMTHKKFNENANMKPAYSPPTGLMSQMRFY